MDSITKVKKKTDPRKKK